MQYFPEANLDMNYINSYGYDLRKLDSLLPPDCRSFDVMDFLRNPQHKLVTRMQIQQYIVRYLATISLRILYVYVYNFQTVTIY